MRDFRGDVRDLIFDGCRGGHGCEVWNDVLGSSARKVV